MLGYAGFEHSQGAAVEALILLLALALAITALAVAKRAARLARQSDARWADLTARIHALEEQVPKLTAQVAQLVTLGQQPRQPPGAISPRAAEVPKAGALAGLEAAPAATPAEELVTPGLTLPAEARGFPPLPGAGVPEPAVPSPPLRPQTSPEPTLPRPLFSSTLAAAETSRRVLSIEEMLGANWLNKLGVIILVIGVALFLAYELKTLGPAGKILVGYVVGAALLIAGLLFEKREPYRILARAGIGGGWALLYFTTYAMHHVEAARIIASQAVDLVLLLIVAAAMVAHTLRYNSQVVTGLATLLGFATVTISHVNVYSLLASAILAAAIVVMVQRRHWYELEVIGILATYLNHWY